MKQKEAIIGHFQILLRAVEVLECAVCHHYYKERAGFFPFRELVRASELRVSVSGVRRVMEVGL